MRVSRESVSIALFNLLATTTILSPSEAWTVPATPYQVTVNRVSLFSADVGVNYASGGALVKVPSSPASGQYSVAAGLYTFNAADSSAAVLINYTYSFALKSRTAKIWTDVDASLQPALFLIATGEHVDQENLGLSRYTLGYNCLVYARADTAQITTPETELNSIRDAVDITLQSVPKGLAQRLSGNLVTNAWIEGDVLVDTGIIDQQMAIVIPIKVLTAI